MIYTLYIVLTILSRPPAYSQRAGPAIKQELAIIQNSIKEVVIDTFYFNEDTGFFTEVRELTATLTFRHLTHAEFSASLWDVSAD